MYVYNLYIYGYWTWLCELLLRFFLDYCILQWRWCGFTIYLNTCITRTHTDTHIYTKRHVFFDSILHYQFPFKIRQSLKRMRNGWQSRTNSNERSRRRRTCLKGERKRQYLLFSFSFNAREGKYSLVCFACNFFSSSIFPSYSRFPLPWSICMVPVLEKWEKKKISLYLHLYYRIYITHSTHDTMGCKSWSIDSIRYYYMYTCANISLNKKFQMWQKVEYACGCVCEICNCLHSGFYVNGVR